jgi:hypothetical protein
VYARIFGETGQIATFGGSETGQDLPFPKRNKKENTRTTIYNGFFM